METKKENKKNTREVKANANRNERNSDKKKTAGVKLNPEAINSSIPGKKRETNDRSNSEVNNSAMSAQKNSKEEKPIFNTKS